MNLKAYLLLFTHLFFIHHSNAFNITNILNQYPSFSTFNGYLSETNLSTEINSHRSVTVFAIPNNAVSNFSGKPYDALKNLLSVHVVLDYYDFEKLKNVSSQNGQMATLFQTTGQALGLQGFLKASVLHNGDVYIGSATQGPSLGASLVRSIACEPCNVSVIHISTAIVPVGMELGPVLAPGSGPGPSPSPASSEPPTAPVRKLAPIPAPPTSSPNGAPPPASSPNGAPPPASSPNGASPPSPDPPMKAPSESPADTPPRSPPGPPPSPPPSPAEKDKSNGVSNTRIGLDFVMALVLLSIYLIV